MPNPQHTAAWAICHDDSGLMVFTVRNTRKEAIRAFMDVAEGKGQSLLWPRYRRKGWRASHVLIEEMLPQPEPHR